MQTGCAVAKEAAELSVPGLVSGGQEAAGVVGDAAAAARALRGLLVRLHPYLGFPPVRKSITRFT